MYLKLITHEEEKTVPLVEATAFLSDHQSRLQSETQVTLKILQNDEVFWAEDVLFGPFESSNIFEIIRQSFHRNKVPMEEQEKFISELKENMNASGGAGKSTSPSEEKHDATTPPKRKERLKSDKEEVEKHHSDGARETAELGKQAQGAVSSFKVIALVLILPLVYFGALLVIITQLALTNLWVIIGVMLASSVVLCWYITSVIKSAQRKVLEKEVTPEVFKFVVYHQLKQKEKLDKQLELYKVLHDSPEALRLTTPENVHAVHQLVEEIAE